MSGRFFGKYRGTVANNIDPRQMGRVQVQVPSVLGDNRLNWAMPCAPYTGDGVGFFMVPPIGAHIWVEFESGDPDYPIWAGGFWEEGQAPASPAVPTMKVIKTDTATVTINDLPGAGGVKIETTSGMKIEITLSGIEINNGAGGSLKLTGPNVSVNNGALEVT